MGNPGVIESFVEQVGLLWSDSEEDSVVKTRRVAPEVQMLSKHVRITYTGVNTTLYLKLSSVYYYYPQ